MGVCAGSVATAPEDDNAAGERREWVGATAASAVLLAVLLAAFGWRHQESDLSHYFLILDAVAGAFTASLLIVVSAAGPATGAERLRRAFASRPFVRAGTWAYSLYLLHFPLLRLLTERILKPLFPDAGRVAHFATLTLLGIPLVLVASWAFFCVVERPFLSRSRAPSGGDEDARRAALSPAP
jgi:peptidoglycan/LPS O-acetylase OafA/YrhL